VYRVASNVNSNVSKQWFCDKYAMKALSVHGGDAVFASTSSSVGRRGQYGPVAIERLRGLEGGTSPDDMKPSSSASQSERTDEQRGDISFVTGLMMYNAGGFRSFDRRIALRRYFMSTECDGSFLQQTGIPPVQRFADPNVPQQLSCM
jgi:hypothetical protein